MSAVLALLASVISPINILLSVFGVFVGILFGALPGFTAAMGVAVLLPLTYTMGAASGLILLGAIFSGAMYGGSISAILINTPGTPSAAATVLDGYAMAKKGRAAEALRESITASFIGGLFGVTALLFLSPPLARISIMFGPPEYFFLALFGLTIIVTISEKSMIKGFLSGLLGLIIATIGMGPLLGTPRFNFGSVNLLDGVQLVPAMIGLFSFSEILNIISSFKSKAPEGEMAADVKKIRIGFPKLRHILEFLPIYLRSAIIGTGVGILPGAGGSIASFLSYNETKRASKTPEQFGTGIPEGVAASEAANNAMAGGALIPMLTLGVPGDAVSAIIMGGLMVHGLMPGGDLYTRNSGVVYTFILALYLANIIMLLFGIYCAPYFTLVHRVPKHMLAVSVALLTVVGSYALRCNIFDVYVMVFFGILGYLMKSHGFDVVPAVLGMILGPMAEKGLNASIAIAGERNIVPYVAGRPISMVLVLLIVLSIAIPIHRRRRARGAQASA